MFDMSNISGLTSGPNMVLEVNRTITGFGALHNNLSIFPQLLKRIT